MKRIHIYTAVLMLLCFSSCEKFLDQELHQAINADEAISELNDAQVALTGCYDKLQEIELYARDFMVIADLAADNSRMNAANAGRFVNIYQWNITAANAYLEGIWEKSYAAMFQINKLLTDLPSVDDGTQAEKDRIEGEAKVIRALIYFNLVNVFAQDYNYPASGSFTHFGVPVITELLEVDANPGRDLVSAVYTQILADLEGNSADKGAVDLLQPGNSPFYVNQNTAKALLSRVYLYMIDPNDPSGSADHVQKVLDYSQEVIDAGMYDLVPNDRYAESWYLVDEEQNEELIFSIRFTETDNWSVDMLGDMYMEQGYGDIVATDDLLNLYNDNDVRLNWFRSSDGLNIIEKYPGRRTGEEPEGTVIDESINNHTVLRLAEMYLNAAEAAYLDDDETAAQEYVNAITARAGANQIVLSGSDLLEAIKAERRKELCFEGHRLWDIKRWHDNVEREDLTNPSVRSEVEYPNPLFAYPIPESEMNTNSTLRAQQNPGY